MSHEKQDNKDGAAILINALLGAGPALSKAAGPEAPLQPTETSTETAHPDQGHSYEWDQWGSWRSHARRP